VPILKPAVVRGPPENGKIFVFTWPVHNVTLTQANTWQQTTPG